MALFDGREHSMAVTDAVTFKRQLLVEALARCAEIATRDHGITLDTLRSLFKSAITEWWREGELRLEPAWKLLCAQPGIVPAAVAPPMLFLRTLEAKLDTRVRLPDALTGIPPREQQRLLESIPRDVVVALTATIEQARLDAEAAYAEEVAKQQASLQTQKAESAETQNENVAAHQQNAEGVALRSRRRLAFLLFPLALIVLAGSLFFSFRDTSGAFDLTAYAQVLVLSDGKRDGKTVIATLNDPKWASTNKDDRQKLLRNLLDRMSLVGVEAITLMDSSGRVRAVVYTVGGSRNVVLR